MEKRTVARITDWDRREVGDGRAGLSKLGDAGFSGAVETGDAWLFMLNGRIVGTTGGSVDALGTRDTLTAYTAPHPSLPLLFAMRERGGDTQGRYFTDDTALAEVHDTLSSESFTGYIELSENVHSGDYHVVYYGGRALSAAFVGSAERLVTGDDAFERANEEVGIYEVNSVDLDVRDVPEPRDDATAAGGGTAAGAATGTHTRATEEPGSRSGSDPTGETNAAGSGPAEYTIEDSVEGLRDPDPDAARTRADEPDPGGEDSGVDAEDADGGGDAGNATDAQDAADPQGVGAAESSKPASNAGGKAGASGTPDARDAGGQQTPDESTDEATGGRARDSPSPKADRRSRSGARTDRKGSIASGRSDGTDEGGIPWDDGRTVPALDPARTAVPAEGADAESEPEGAASPPTEPSPDTSDAGEPADGEVASDRIADLEAELEELRENLQSLRAEHDRVTAERDQLLEEREELRTRLEDFRAERETAETDLTPREALANTDLFVRYDAKTRDTLADAHDGDATPETVGANLRLETHTRFDGDASVDGEAFESFLQDTLAYRFVAWLTGEFIFEIRDTGNEAALRDLYDAIPEIDRAEFDGTVTSRDASGEEVSTAFDVVLRNQMGEPLLVADVDEGRDPTDGAMMDDLLDRATTVVEATGSLAGVFLITASFFDNEVHGAVRDATKTGFLGRDSRTNFVKTSRNEGYHVCLVEARSDRFHLSRPGL